MKIQTLTKEARDICIKARARQKDHFHNDSFWLSAKQPILKIQALRTLWFIPRFMAHLPSIETDNSTLRVEMGEECTSTTE